MSTKIKFIQISILLLAVFLTLVITPRISLKGHKNMTQTPISRNEVTTSEGYRLSVKLDKEEVKQGDTVFLSVKIQNVTKRILYLFDSYPEKDYKISIVSMRGSKPALTDLGKQLLNNAGDDFRRVRVKVLPGQDMHYKIEISKFYNLLPNNTYHITVNRQVFKIGTLDRFSDVSSNNVRLRVVR